MTEHASGTAMLTQVGIIVQDIEAKTRAWAEILGLPVPEILITDSYDRAQTEYKGEPSAARARLALFHLGQVDLELIEPIDGPSAWQDQLDEQGEGLHHIAFEVEDIRGKVASLEARELSLVQRGEYPGGRYAYFDGRARLGAILELQETD
jgi:catechol 2,3-dioxygenase-like lactoylglutathione lyase family enzyme